MKRFTFVKFAHFAPEYEIYKDDKFTVPKSQKTDIISKGEMAEGVYFILSGRVRVGNRTRVYRYFTLPETGFFGEISILFGVPSKYNYYYEDTERVGCYFISADDFKEVCNKYPGSGKIIKERALIRKKAFK